MPGIPLFTGTLPPADSALGWCTICAMLWKHEGLKALGDQVQQVPDGQARWFSLDTPGRRDRHKLMGAVAFGIFQPLAAPPMGTGMMPLPVPLCWSHLMGLELKMAGLLPASATDMPQGAVLLGQQGRR